MEVLLINNVPRVGRKGEIITVAEGYARNFLFPRNFAVAATAGAKRHLELMRSSWEKQDMREQQVYQTMADKLEGAVLKITKKAGETGRLFGSVTNSELAEQIKEQLSVNIDRKLVVADHIKDLGEHEVTIRFTGDIKAAMKVIVVAEAAAETVAEA